MGGNTPGLAPFAFLQYEYLTRSKPLGGPQAGAIVDAANLTNPEPFGLDLNHKKPSYGGGEEEESGLGAGGVIEIAAAVLVFVGGGLFFMYSYPRRKTSSKGGAVLQGHSASQMRKMSYGPDGSNSRGYPPHQQQQQQPSHTLPMAPITPVPQQHQTYQDQIQALQFSSHPRPSFVTTTAEEHETAAAAPTIGTPQSLWQPKPFVPPARPYSSTTTPLSPANTERVTITATTANSTPAGTTLLPPRVPQFPYPTRPQAPQHFGDQDVITAGVSGY